MRKKIIFILVLSLLFFLPGNKINGDNAKILRNGDANNLIFIHHSCGENWLNEGLYNALIAKGYINEVNEIYYGTDLLPDDGRPDSLAPVPGDKTNMNHWILWFNDYLNHIKMHDCESGINKIIMFKSCFPISNIESNGTEPGNPFDDEQTLANYKAVYRHPNGTGNTYFHNGYIYKPLEDIFAENPDILFIPVTAPPRHYAPWDATNDAEAHRARIFNNWLKNEWLTNYNTNHPALKNVAVFDWFDFLAYPDNHSFHPNRLKAEYGGESGDSHPNTLANIESTEVFATNPDNFIDNSWNAFNGSNFFNFNLNKGWNLITLPYENSYNASKLFNDIEECNIILSWNASVQDFIIYVPDSPYDFAIENGHSYFIGMNNNSIFSLTGVPITNVSINLFVGWNCLGWFRNNTVNASSIYNAISNCSIVLKWNNSKDDFNLYVPGADDFIIK
ncbi:MAG TPA: hypothetical protein ENI33_00080, partial [Thermoplasmatales archaeon]|nr:hypothetical protein [Thermoplasmatales archaeon]